MTEKNVDEVVEIIFEGEALYIEIDGELHPIVSGAEYSIPAHIAEKMGVTQEDEKNTL